MYGVVYTPNNWNVMCWQSKSQSCQNFSKCLQSNDVPNLLNVLTKQLGYE